MNPMPKRDKYNTGAHSVYLCQYHLVWCPKFRFKVLKDAVEVELKQIFKDIAIEYDYEIIEMEVMPDHVHLFVGAKPSVAPSDIVRTMKSISAIRLFKKFKPLKDYYRRCGGYLEQRKVHQHNWLCEC